MWLSRSVDLVRRDLSVSLLFVGFVVLCWNTVDQNGGLDKNDDCVAGSDCRRGGGTSAKRPRTDRTPPGYVWPRVDSDDTGSRVVNQIDISERHNFTDRDAFKLIFHHGMDERLAEGGDDFRHCSVKSCSFTTDRKRLPLADAVLLERVDAALVERMLPKPTHQIWIVYSIESPRWDRFVAEKLDLRALRNLVNWTITPRRDSTIPRPYALFRRSPSFTKIEDYRMTVNHAAGKTKKSAIIVSNCNETTNGRLNYVLKLRKYFPVEVYGHCVKMRRCYKDECTAMLRSYYKFYLAFENSNCKDYITEKFHYNLMK